MKTSHFLSRAFLLITSLPALAQHTEQSAYYSGTKQDTRISLFANAQSNHIVLNGVPSKFLKEFPMAKNVKLSNVNGMRKAVFTLNGLTTKAFYNPDNTFSYSLTNYPEQRLPEEVLRNVYRTYKKYKITSAKEVKETNRNSFYITLENGSNYKIIKVTNNFIEQIGKLKKEEADREEE